MPNTSVLYINGETHNTGAYPISSANMDTIDFNESGATYQSVTGDKTYRLTIARTATKENGASWPTTRAAIRLEKAETLVPAGSSQPVKLKTHVTLVVSRPDVKPAGMDGRDASVSELAAQLLAAILGRIPEGESFEIVPTNVDPLIRAVNGSN